MRSSIVELLSEIKFIYHNMIEWNTRPVHVIYIDFLVQNLNTSIGQYSNIIEHILQSTYRSSHCNAVVLYGIQYVLVRIVCI